MTNISVGVRKGECEKNIKRTRRILSVVSLRIGGITVFKCIYLCETIACQRGENGLKALFGNVFGSFIEVLFAGTQ